MLLLFQKDLCRNCPVSGHLAEVTVSQAGEGMQRREGWKEWKKLQKVSEQMEAKERIDVEEERLMEVQGGGESLLLHNLSLSLSLSFFGLFSSPILTCQFNCALLTGVIMGCVARVITWHIKGIHDHDSSSITR